MTTRIQMTLLVRPKKMIGEKEGERLLLRRLQESLRLGLKLCSSEPNAKLFTFIGKEFGVYYSLWTCVKEKN